MGKLDCLGEWYGSPGFAWLVRGYAVAAVARQQSVYPTLDVYLSIWPIDYTDPRHGYTLRGGRLVTGGCSYRSSGIKCV